MKAFLLLCAIISAASLKLDESSIKLSDGLAGLPPRLYGQQDDYRMDENNNFYENNYSHNTCRCNPPNSYSTNGIVGEGCFTSMADPNGRRRHLYENNYAKIKSSDCTKKTGAGHCTPRKYSPANHPEIKCECLDECADCTMKHSYPIKGVVSGTCRQIVYRNLATCQQRNQCKYQCRCWKVTGNCNERQECQEVCGAASKLPGIVSPDQCPTPAPTAPSMSVEMEWKIATRRRRETERRRRDQRTRRRNAQTPSQKEDTWKRFKKCSTSTSTKRYQMCKDPKPSELNSSCVEKGFTNRDTNTNIFRCGQKCVNTSWIPVSLYNDNNDEGTTNACCEWRNDDKECWVYLQSSYISANSKDKWYARNLEMRVS